MYSTFKLNKQGDTIQPWHTPFPIWNQSVLLCPVAFWPAHRFLRRQVRWSGIPISWRIFHSVLWSTWSKVLVVNKAGVDVFLELSCFFYDPTNVGNLISGSSAISKFSVNIYEQLYLENKLFFSLLFSLWTVGLNRRLKIFNKHIVDRQSKCLVVPFMEYRWRDLT